MLKFAFRFSSVQLPFSIWSSKNSTVTKATLLVLYVTVTSLFSTKISVIENIVSVVFDAEYTPSSVLSGLPHPAYKVKSSVTGVVKSYFVVAAGSKYHPVKRYNSLVGSIGSSIVSPIRTFCT